MSITDGVLIRNKADFQRHLNGCERRITNLTKDIQALDTQLQKLSIIDKRDDQHQVFLDNFHRTCTQHESLNNNVSTLYESEFGLNATSRLKILKNNIERNIVRFEKIKTATEHKFGVGFIRMNIDSTMDDNIDDEQQQQLMKMAIYEKENIELDLLSHRSDAFNRIEQDLTLLKTTFDDLQGIVYAQGIIVDNIEQSLSNTDEMIVEAMENVKTTVRQKKRSSRTKWILLLILICGLLIVILIIFLIFKFAMPFG